MGLSAVHQPDFCATLMVPTPLRRQEIPQMNPDKAHCEVKTISGDYIMKLIERRPSSAVDKANGGYCKESKICNIFRAISCFFVQSVLCAHS